METLDSTFERIDRAVGVIAVDTETTGLSVADGRDYCIGISVAFYEGPDLVSFYFPLRHSAGENLFLQDRQRLFNVLLSKPLVFHNLKFDLHSLATVGFVPVGKLYCTQIMAHMVNENEFSKELDYLGGKYVGAKKETEYIKGLLQFFKKWEAIPGNLMDLYARQDTIVTRRLFDYYVPQMEDQELTGLWPVEADFLRLLAKIERRGILLDRDLCLQEAARGRERMAQVAEELGFEPSKPAQLAAFLLEELNLPVLKRSKKTQKPSFDKEVMEEYDLILSTRDDPSAKLLREFRGWQTSVGSSYQGWLDRVSPDGRLRPNFKLHGTRTGRLSCENPNLQQIPRASANSWNQFAKPCFVAPEGYGLWEFDYSQLEYRVAGAYGKERELLDGFANDENFDPFERTAIEVFGEFTPITRQYAKTTTYSIQYGAGVPRVSHALGISPEVAKTTIERYYGLHPGIRRATQRATFLAERDGFVKYWTGRRRHFDRYEGSHKAFNSVVQGGCAELMKRKMLELDDLVDSDDCQMLLQVHDSIVFQIKDELLDEAKPLIEKTMMTWDEAPDVPLKVEGKRWGN